MRGAWGRPTQWHEGCWRGTLPPPHLHLGALLVRGWAVRVLQDPHTEGDAPCPGVVQPTEMHVSAEGLSGVCCIAGGWCGSVGLPGLLMLYVGSGRSTTGQEPHRAAGCAGGMVAAACNSQVRVLAWVTLLRMLQSGA